jgi:hypothetical protein
MGSEKILEKKVARTVEVADNAYHTGDVEDYKQLDLHIRSMEEMARELFQEQLRKPYESIVVKLEHGEPLTGEEQEVLEFFIVGVAKYYIKEEENFDQWREELGRLTQEIENVSMKRDLSSVDGLLYLQALCRDAQHVLPEVIFYLEEKERIRRFREATEGVLDPQGARFLADILRGMMSSFDM